MLIAILLPIVAFCAFFVYCYWRLYEKMGEKGWYSIIPFYGPYVLYRHTWGPQWWIPFFGGSIIAFVLGYLSLPESLSSLIELVVTFGLAFVTNMNLYSGFGHGTGFSVLGTFFPFITIPICALSDDDYIGGRH
jgi:hypothetical protein